MKYIQKASGELEPFDLNKFRQSLQRSGASLEIVGQLAHEIEQRMDLKTTHDIYSFALEELKRLNRPVAARYNLKRALLEFGPTGFPFEQFVAELFKAQGFETKTDQEVMGFCVWHEVDVIAHKNNEHYLMECKFHNEQKFQGTIKTALYVQARFEDIKANTTTPERFDGIWLVTNTKFTDQAIQYGLCVNMHMLSWSYPSDKSLARLIDKYGLHPITTLTSLSLHQKKELIGHGFVLCRDAEEKQAVLELLRIPEKQKQEIIKEALGVCSLRQ